MIFLVKKTKDHCVMCTCQPDWLAKIRVGTRLLPTGKGGTVTPARGINIAGMSVFPSNSEGSLAPG